MDFFPRNLLENPGKSPKSFFYGAITKGKGWHFGKKMIQKFEQK